MKYLSLLFVAFSLVTAASSAKAEDLEFTLINSSSYVISQLQISPVSTNNWEENILGRDVVLQKEETVITIADGLSTCKYDMLITFVDGETIEERNYDFCELGSYEARD
jgi:hypothetical protein